MESTRKGGINQERWNQPGKVLWFYFCYCWCCGKIRRYNQLNWYATCTSDICRNPFHTVHEQDSTLPQLRNRAMYEASMIIWVHSICLELQLITNPPSRFKDSTPLLFCVARLSSENHKNTILHGLSKQAPEKPLDHRWMELRTQVRRWLSRWFPRNDPFLLKNSSDRTPPQWTATQRVLFKWSCAATTGSTPCQHNTW